MAFFADELMMSPPRQKWKVSSEQAAEAQVAAALQNPAVVRLFLEQAEAAELKMVQ